MESTFLNLEKLCKSRSSCRRFKPGNIPESAIEKIITIAKLSPYAGGRKNWDILAITDQTLKQSMANAIEEKIESATRDMDKAEAAMFRDYGKNFLFFTQAPVTFAVFMEPYISAADTIMRDHGLSQAEIDHQRGRTDYQSIGAAIQNLLLAAHAMGYGGCWMCGPVVAADAINQLLEVEPPYSLVALVPVGVPAENPPQRPRKSLEEVFKLVK